MSDIDRAVEQQAAANQAEAFNLGLQEGQAALSEIGQTAIDLAKTAADVARAASGDHGALLDVAKDVRDVSEDVNRVADRFGPVADEMHAGLALRDSQNELASAERDAINNPGQVVDHLGASYSKLEEAREAISSMPEGRMKDLAGNDLSQGQKNQGEAEDRLIRMADFGPLERDKSGTPDPGQRFRPPESPSLDQGISK